MKYTAINIGPIIATLSLMRKPRHLWSASFIFSHLMTKIISAGIAQGGELLSLRKPNKSEKPGIGLFPDRAFFKSDKELKISEIISESLTALSKDISSNAEPITKEDLEKFFNIMGVQHTRTDKESESEIISESLTALSKDISLNAEPITEEDLEKFFNIMGVQHTRTDKESESEIILKLNKELDALELLNRREDSAARTKVLDLLMTGGYSKLYRHAFDGEEFSIKSLREISASEIIPEEMSQNIRKSSNEFAKNYSAHIEKNNSYDKDVDYSQEIDEETNKYISDYTTQSYQNYFCIVQADGDKMGKVIAALNDGDLMKVSAKLLEFGKAACDLVAEYGGQPIYAGGDDLLFICPVVSKPIDIEENGKRETKTRNIFTLIDEIDEKYKVVQQTVEDLDITNVETTMSYGVSISYYKYPLYEAFGVARQLLETAKNDDKFEDKEKNRIVVQLRKHSGSPLEFDISKFNIDLKTSFNNLIAFSNDENLVSQVSHKLRANEDLLKISQVDVTRLQAFFEKFIGLGEKKTAEDKYIEEVKNIYNLLDACKKGSIYSILRIAKFINGEKVKS